MDKEHITQNRYAYKKTYTKSQSKSSRRQPAKFSITLTTKKDSNLHTSDCHKHASPSIACLISPRSNNAPITAFRISNTNDAAKSDRPKKRASHMLSKLTEKLNHETTRNSDLLISRMLSCMAEKKGLTKTAMGKLQYERLVVDRRRLSRFITEPSGMQLALDAQWSLKELGEVANTGFWQMLERDRQKEKIRNDIGKMVLRKKSVPVLKTALDHKMQSTTNKLGLYGEQVVIRRMIQDDIEALLYEEEDRAQRALSRFTPVAVVVFYYEDPPCIWFFSCVQIDTEYCYIRWPASKG